MLVAHVGRDDVLVELGPLARDVVAVAQLVDVRFERVVDHVAAAVGDVAVGVAVAAAPLYLVVAQGVLARDLSVVGCAAAVVVLGRTLQVGLGRHAVTPCVAVVAYLVEDVLELILVVAALGEEREVDHGAHADIVVELVVGAVAQVVVAVVGHVVHAEEVVLHILIGAELVGVVGRGYHAQFAGAEVPVASQAHAELQVAQGMHGRGCPVVVEVVAHEAHAVVGAQGIEPGLYAAMHGPQSAVESKEVGRRSLCLCKGSQRGGGVPVAAHLQAESVFLWYALCVDNDESARIVGRIFGGRCFHDGQIVNLAAWNHVEGERPRIGL